MRVVLDPGHGGDEDVDGSSWNNATGPTGLFEKNVTLDVALSAQLYLGGLGVDCRLTRSTDHNLGLQCRAAVANDWPADAFVSIHFNASVGHNAQGTETWRHTQANAPSRSLRTAVQAATVGATGLADREEKIGNFGVLRPDYHHSSTGVCLVEVSFMDRADEEARLKQASYKDRIARGLAQGIYGWLVSNGRAKLPGFDPVKFTDDTELPEPQDGYDMNGGADSDAPESCGALGFFAAFDAEAAPGDLTPGQKIPNASEVATCGAMMAKIVRGTPAFNTLVQNNNADIVFKNEEGTGADRMMSPRMKTKLDALAVLVKAEWSGVKLRVTEAWDEDDEHNGTSLHYEGRAADITTSPVDGAKLGRLGRLAVDAGFDWVIYEDATHVQPWHPKRAMAIAEKNIGLRWSSKRANGATTIIVINYGFGSVVFIRRLAGPFPRGGGLRISTSLPGRSRTQFCRATYRAISRAICSSFATSSHIAPSVEPRRSGDCCSIAMMAHLRALMISFSRPN